VNRLQIMPTLERRALLAAIGEAWHLATAETAIPAGMAENGDTPGGPTSPEVTMRDPIAISGEGACGISSPFLTMLESITGISGDASHKR
jgi:hypothetical protein